MEKIKDALAKARLQSTSVKPTQKVLEQESQPKFSNTENELGKINYLNTFYIKNSVKYLT